jgi:hypothetical protein
MTIPTITLFGYRFIRLNFTGGSQYQMYFSITDELVTKNRWLWWFQDIPGRTQAALDSAMVAAPGHHLKVEIIADDKAPATHFSVVDNTVTLDTLITEAPTKIGIAKIAQPGGMWVRLSQDGGHHMMLRFGGTPSAGLLGKIFVGQIKTWAPTKKYRAHKPGLPAAPQK